MSRIIIPDDRPKPRRKSRAYWLFVLFNVIMWILITVFAVWFLPKLAAFFYYVFFLS